MAHFFLIKFISPHSFIGTYINNYISFYNNNNRQALIQVIGQNNTH